jgi:serine/threonine protein phosphatase PrpC
MAELAAFSERDIATRERLEDYAANSVIKTAAGLSLQVILVCDGAGGGEVGELAARLTARTIFEFLEVSAETSVPKLLMKAVEKANSVVYSELRGAGTSTVALAAVNLSDPSPNGRLHIASVGNSRIYLLRDGQLARLNIDHRLANEYYYAGQMSFEEAAALENGDYVTRMIGVGPNVQVDIGFYAERGKTFVNSRRAFRIGQHGMLLQEGDTVLAATDGLFELDDDGKPFVHEDELLRHALDNDVERAGRALMEYAANRRPKDNTALSLLFVPSRMRRPVLVGAGLSRGQKTGIVFSAVIALVVVGFLGLQLAQAQSERGEMAAIASTATQFAIVQAYTATPTATASPTPTATPSPTPTLRPTAIAPGQVGVRYIAPPAALPPNVAMVQPGRLAAVLNPLQISYLSIAGEKAFLGSGGVAQPGNVYLQADTQAQISRVVDPPATPSFDMLLYPPTGDIFVNTGEYQTGGVSVSLLQNEGIKFEAQTQCIAAKQIPKDVTKPNDKDKVAFTCFTGYQGDCTYKFPGAEPEVMPIGKRVLLDIENRQWIEDGPIQYSEVKSYVDTVLKLTNNIDQVKCLNPYLDADGDGLTPLTSPADQCPNDAGPAKTNGCPDKDGDGVPDNQDQCPAVVGDPAFKGCPPPTATPLPDIDGDGLSGAADLCPAQPGPKTNNGCPASSESQPAAPPAYGAGAIDDLFVVREAQREQTGHQNNLSMALLLTGGLGAAGVVASRRRRR